MSYLVKWAVARALASDGDDAEARRQLDLVDPLLRARARKRLQSEVEAVLAQTPNIATGRPLLQAIAQRLDVTAARDERRAPIWWATPLVALLVVGALGMWTYRQMHAPPPFDPARVEALPESADAYQNGGRPISLGAAGEELFGKALLGFELALDRYARADSQQNEAALDHAERQLLAAPHRELLGPDVFAALTRLTAACRATLIDGESVLGDADELNVALAARGLAYYIDTDTDTLEHDQGTTPILYAHFVERVRVFDVPGRDPERVLWLRRLDRLNLRTSLAGSTHEGAKAAVVRDEVVSAWVLSDFLPTLASDATFPLWKGGAGPESHGRKDKLEARSGAKIRQELTQAGVAPPAANELAGLLRERRRLFTELERQAKASGWQIAVPTGYRFDMRPYQNMEQDVSRQLLRDLSYLDEKLGAAAMGSVYTRVRQLYVGALERHEVQHRLDYAQKLQVPAALAPWTGPVAPGAEASPFARRLAKEYSAYLAEIADGPTPWTSLIRLSSHVFDSAGWSSTYADTAAAIIDSLAQAVGIAHSDFVVNHDVQRNELARVMLALLDHSSAELSAAARQAWQTTFGAPLAQPRLRVAAAAPLPPASR